RTGLAEDPHISRRHLLDADVGVSFVIEIQGLQAVEWLLGPQLPRQLEIADDIPVSRMDKKQRWVFSSGLNGNHMLRSGDLLAQELGELTDGPVIDESREQDTAIELLADLRHEPHGLQGVAAESEEIVL